MRAALPLLLVACSVTPAQPDSHAAITDAHVLDALPDAQSDAASPDARTPDAASPDAVIPDAAAADAVQLADCGHVGQQCCTSGGTATQGTCYEENCTEDHPGQPLSAWHCWPCGGSGERCCTDGSPACDTGLVCMGSSFPDYLFCG